MFQVASNVEPGVLMPLIVFVFTRRDAGVAQARRAAGARADVDPAGVDERLQRLRRRSADPTGVVAEIVEPGLTNAV